MGVEKLERQIKDINDKNKELKICLKCIKKGIEAGRSEFCIKGAAKYDVLSILTSSDINYSYQNGKLSILNI